MNLQDMNEMIVDCSEVISWHLHGIEDKCFQKPSESVAELGRDTKPRPLKHGHECDTIGRNGQIYFIVCIIFRWMRAYIAMGSLTSSRTSNRLPVCTTEWNNSVPTGGFFQILCCEVLLNP
jgi:hypothetical protein